MNPSSWVGAGEDNSLQILWADGERVFCRAETRNKGFRSAVLAVLPAAEHPTPAVLGRLAREYELKDELDGVFAVRPLELLREGGRTILVLEDTRSEPLDRLLGAPIEVRSFLRLAIEVAAALTQVHRRGLVHKDIKPANILVDRTTGKVKLTGFGIASRLPRERQAPAPPESIAGTLAYMAPEQTGRVNRSIDARSDLYALGVTFYQMLTGSLPFTASDPMEWVHCHIARKPPSPSERLDAVPALVSALILKLLAKTAEERYQTAAGLERDLRSCLAAWEARQWIDVFPLGQHDTSDQLLIPEKLYGREREIEILLAAFDRVVTSGRPELVLVSGYSGIGKSSVVNELHKALVPSRGLFASGKFDQYKRDIPYAPLAQAFQSLIRPLLGKSDAELQIWRGAFLEALEPNARLMTDLIPELKLIVGDPPPVPELEPQQAQSRFQLVFRRFIGVFARPNHPLDLFFDDLQWLDAATLDLLEDLLTRSELQHLILIGAYRDNEVDATHPLARKLEAIKNAGGMIETITLAPLTHRHLGELIADALHCESERTAPLAELVHDKTAGNPFFAIQFMSSLAEEGMLTFDHDATRWSWDLLRIHAKGYTDNVVDLMIAKLTRLPAETQQALQQMACLGNVAEIAMLAIILQMPEEQVHAALWPAVRQDQIERRDGSYKFMHDRVQEAAYSLIPEALRAEVHLRIGRLLVARTPTEEREEAIFEIVNQLNRGAALIPQREEREQLAEFNLIAGKRAKASTAYASGVAYLDAGAALLARDCWERRHGLAFALDLNRAECEFLTGQVSVAEERLAALSDRAGTTIEQAFVACLHIDVCLTMDRSGRAVAVCLDYLRHVDIEWSPHPSEEELRREYDHIWSLLGSRTVEEAIDLPLMDDPAFLATVEVLSKASSPAVYTDANLSALTICKAVSLSLEQGNCDASCFAYVMLATVAGPRFGDYQAGFRFGQIGYDLAQRRGLKRFEARTYLSFAIFVVSWIKHVRASRDLLRCAFEAANRIGDLTYGAYTRNNLNTNLLFAGDPLPKVHGEAEHGLAYAKKARFGLVIDIIAVQLALIQMLRGLTLKFGCFDDGQFNELQMEHHLSSNPALAIATCWYWIRKLQARYLAGDYAAAMDAASKSQELLWTSSSNLEEAEHHFYAALARAAYCGSAPADERQLHIDAIAAHHRRLQVWAANCPENFENRAALVGAEIARIEGRDVDAMRLYEQAIHSARANGFIHNEALAYERASAFYGARGFDRFAELYLRNARYGYLRWGAEGKVRQLEETRPHLMTEEAAPGPTSTIGAPAERLDTGAVIKASQAVSGEILLDRLIETLMTIALEHAGAQRGLLIRIQGEAPQIEAEARTEQKMVVVTVRQEVVTQALLPESLLHTVIRTRQSVILNDAAVQSPFSADDYIREKRSRSILCVPLVKQTQLLGVLYLENSLTSHVFTPARISLLELLASQAAISLENARLYGELMVSEDRWRKLFETVPVGVNLVGSDRRYVAANPAFQRMTGYSEAELRGLSPLDITHEDDRAASEQIIAAQVAGQPYLQHREKRFRRKDGGVIWTEVDAFLVPVAGSAPFLAGVTVDVTERKRADAQLRESEQRYREMQTALAHANRVATMGQLTASIAHEVSQPIAAAAINAEAASLWLTAQPPNLEEVRQTLARIVESSNRAGEVIGRIRALIKKAPLRKGRLDINAAIREVLELASGEAEKNGVSVHTHFADGLPLIHGDRVQLQQVILNLIINAVQAMAVVSDGERELLVSTGSAEPEGVLVTVRDSGPGLPPSSSERLFDAFYTTKADGMGMGLSISRSIVEAHGGRLWSSANLPRGAIFQFTAPADPDV
jgi:PAS domain S-box-containing protein